MVSPAQKLPVPQGPQPVTVTLPERDHPPRAARVGRQVSCSIHTVKKHGTPILDTLGATNRTAAIVRARELGLLPSSSPASGHPPAR